MKLDDAVELELVNDALDKITDIYHHFDKMPPEILKERLDDARIAVFNIKYGTSESKIKALKRLLENTNGN